MNTMRRCGLTLTIVSLLTILALTTSGCVPLPPPTLTPSAVTAFDNTRVKNALDLIRDTVDDGTKTTPPVFSGATDRTVAMWHESALTIVNTRGSGWQTTVKAGLDALLTNLPTTERAIVAPYVALAKTLLAEVAP